MTRDTVWWDTPACLATSRMVTLGLFIARFEEKMSWGIKIDHVTGHVTGNIYYRYFKPDVNTPF